MDNFIGFTCVGEDREPIPHSVLQDTKVSYAEAFSKTEGMVKVAERLKGVKDESFCTLPFSVTIEAEALGAEVNIDDKFTTPIIKERSFKNLDEVNHKLSFNLNKGRIKKVLDAVEILSNKGETVVLNVEGPLTILSMLVDTKNIYKEIIKRPKLILDTCEMIIEFLCEYINEGIIRGAKVISYADPFGAYDLVSNNTYKDICGEISYRLLKRLENAIDGCIVHLCGKTSIGFEKAGFCKGVKVKVNGEITYGHALEKAIENKKVKFVGHRCMKECSKIMKVPYYWELKLCENF